MSRKRKQKKKRAPRRHHQLARITVGGKLISVRMHNRQEVEFRVKSSQDPVICTFEELYDLAKGGPVQRQLALA